MQGGSRTCADAALALIRCADGKSSESSFFFFIPIEIDISRYALVQLPRRPCQQRFLDSWRLVSRLENFLRSLLDMHLRKLVRNLFACVATMIGRAVRRFDVKAARIMRISLRSDVLLDCTGHCLLFSACDCKAPRRTTTPLARDKQSLWHLLRHADTQSDRRDTPRSRSRNHVRGKLGSFRKTMIMTSKGATWMTSYA